MATLRNALALSLIILTSASAVHAGQVRLSGGSGNPSVIEVLETTAFVVNSGANFWGYAINFQIPNSVTTLPFGNPWLMTGSSAVSVYKAASGTTQLLGTNFNGNYSDYQPSSLEVRNYGGSDLYFTVDFPNATDYNFVAGDIITLLSGSYQLGTATNGAWISPGSTYEITANSLTTSTEAGDPYSPSYVTTLPEPSGSLIAACAIGLCGALWLRRTRIEV